MKFSIITCTYNSANFLKKNLESVTNQDYHDFEHIFIDGNSNDNTMEIIKQYAAQNSTHVKIFQFPPKGISEAMNQGIKMANGEYLLHLHSDDSFYDGQVLRDAADFLNNNDYDWIYGKAQIIEGDGKPVGVWPQKNIYHYSNKSWFGRYLLKFINFIPHQAVFIKRTVFEKFGMFDETLASAMDQDMWLRIRERTKWSYFDRIICNYCIRRNAQSSGLKNKERNEKNYFFVQKRYLHIWEIPLAHILRFFLNILFDNYR